MVDVEVAGEDDVEEGEELGPVFVVGLTSPTWTPPSNRKGSPGASIYWASGASYFWVAKETELFLVIVCRTGIMRLWAAYWTDLRYHMIFDT